MKPTGNFEEDLKVEKEYDRQIEAVEAHLQELREKFALEEERLLKKIDELKDKRYPFRHRRTHAEFYWGDL